MSILKIKKGPFPSSVIVPSSKSYANRALILAALKSAPVNLINLPLATDVTHLVDALKSIGLDVVESESSLLIKNSFPECESSEKEVFVGEGGTTARFLSVLLLLGHKRYTLKLGQRLKERPWQEYLDLAHKLGAFAELKDDRLIIQGPIKIPQVLYVDCSRTTQFATAFDLVLGKFNTNVTPMNLESSESYWRMNTPLKNHLMQHDHYSIPADWSSAAFPMAFAALNHPIKFPGLIEDPLQADSKILDVLRKLFSVQFHENTFVVGPAVKRASIKLDMRDCLDLFPALSYLVSHIDGTHELSGLQNLAHKESHRLKEVGSLLKEFDRHYEVQGNTIIIHGSEKYCGEKNLKLPDDHRIVMAAALFLRHHSGGTIDNAESINKSYPGFFELLRSE